MGKIKLQVQKKDKPYEKQKQGGKTAPMFERNVPATLSKKIMREAKKQLEEEEQDGTFGGADETMKDAQNGEIVEISAEISDDDDDTLKHKKAYESENFDLDPEEEKAFALFMKGSEKKEAEPSVSLGDIINYKLKEQEESQTKSKISPKMREIYVNVGKFLETFRSGKLPKAFKVLPALTEWEELLYLTRPDKWSPHAMLAGVKLFAINMNPKLCQRFYSVILYPCIREALFENKKLSYYHYMALKKALFKPGAFYKGFLLPLCESGDCTLREATTIGTVLSKVSIPVLQSAAAIYRIAEMEYSPTNSIFLQILINKKYNLPIRVIDAICEHFARFLKDERRMVVSWHNCLLTFVQRYKNDLTAEQKSMIRELIRIHPHYQITPLIRYELDNSVTRGTAYPKGIGNVPISMLG